MCILAHAITHGACTCRHVKRVCIGSWHGEKNPMPHRGLEPASGLTIPLTEWSDCYVHVHPQVAAWKSPAQRARSGGQLWREHLSLHRLPLHPGFHEIFCCQHQHLWRRGHRHWGMLNCSSCSGAYVEFFRNEVLSAYLPRVNGGRRPEISTWSVAGYFQPWSVAGYFRPISLVWMGDTGKRSALEV